MNVFRPRGRLSTHGFCAVLLVGMGTSLPLRLSGAETIQLPLKHPVQLGSVDADSTGVAVTVCKEDPDRNHNPCDGDPRTIKVTDSAIRAKLKQYGAGDYLQFDLVQGTDGFELRDVQGAWRPVDSPSSWARFLCLFFCAAAILGIAALVTRGRPLLFIVGQDNRYSNSKSQVALWFWLVISSYVATVLFRVCYAGWDFWGGVSIPPNLLVLSGLSALTYGGAKAITTAKADAATAAVQKTAAAAAAAAVTTPGAVIAAAVPAIKTTAAQPAFFRDLVQNDFGGFDFGDFQMLVVTLLAAGMYLMLIFHFLHSIEFRKTITLPDLDSTVLALFGLGQGAYLTKKAAGDVGKS